MSYLPVVPLNSTASFQLTAYQLAEKVSLMRRLQQACQEKPSGLEVMRQTHENRRKAEVDVDVCVQQILAECPRKVEPVSEELASFRVFED